MVMDTEPDQAAQPMTGLAGKGSADSRAREVVHMPKPDKRLTASYLIESMKSKAYSASSGSLLGSGQNSPAGQGRG